MAEPTPSPRAEKDDSKPKSRGLSGLFGMNRTRDIGAGGFQALTIGWVLVGCIGLGFFAGAWLDRRAGTMLWTPIGVVLGAAAGFYEMVRTLNQIQKLPKTRPNRAPTSSPGASTTSARNVESETAGEVAARPKPLFSVPPPPRASFDIDTEDDNGEDEDAATPDEEQVLRRLLGEMAEGAKDDDTEEDNDADAGDSPRHDSSLNS